MLYITVHKLELFGSYMVGVSIMFGKQEFYSIRTRIVKESVQFHTKNTGTGKKTLYSKQGQARNQRVDVCCANCILLDMLK